MTFESLRWGIVSPSSANWKRFSAHPCRIMEWACSKCTFLNPPTQLTTCQLCMSPFIASNPSSSSTWSCKSCTFCNDSGRVSCEICGTSAFRSFFSDLEDLDNEELDSSIGSVFIPLRRCKRKNPDTSDPYGSSKSDDCKSENVEKDKSVENSIPHSGSCMKISTSSVNDCSGSDARILKVLSYNVWFREDLELEKRMEAIGNLIEQHSPHVISFQEVTPNIFAIFKRSNWWKEYHCSISNILACESPYFCMQLGRLPGTSFSSKPFHNSKMGRELCVADIPMEDGKRLVIATSHLESPCPAPPTWNQMYVEERVSQAKESISILKNSSNVIFGGDMNWDDKLDGTFPLMDGWIDAWTELRSMENGWTYDTKSNPMLSGNRTLQRRLDRFVCNLHDFEIIGIEMIGVDAIPGISYCKEKKVRKELQKLQLPVLPSDHFGLLLTICRSRKK